MKIYITRHSKTKWNIEKRLQGRKDSPIIQEGVENALALKEYLKNNYITFDAIYCSPIKRAYTTASLIFDESKIICDERLVEMNFGDYEGASIKKLIETSTLYDNLWHHPQNFTRINNGESYDEVIRRATSFIDELLKQNDNQVMIVTHGMFFIVLLCTMLKLDKKDFVLYNQQVVDGCSLTVLDYDGYTFKLEKYNENDFLPNKYNESFSK